MMNITKRFIVDEKGSPKEVVISLEDFERIEEMLGLDLDDQAVNDLRKARHDRETGNTRAYADLDAI